MLSNLDFRDVVHATQSQMLEEFDGENVFQGRIIEVHIGTLLADEALSFSEFTVLRARWCSWRCPLRANTLKEFSLSEKLCQR